MKLSQLSALAPLLFLASSRTAPPPPPPPATLIATDGIKIVYRDAFNQIAPYAPGLTIIMISPTDLVDEEDKYQDQNWWSFSTGCDGGENKEDHAKAEEVLKKAQKNVARILLERGVVTKADIAAINKQDKAAFDNLTWNIALNVLSDSFAATNLSAYSSYFRKGKALVTVPEYYKKDMEGVNFANIDSAYLKPVPGSARDWIQWTLAHEIMGHVENSHNGHSFTEGVDFCKEIDSAYLRENVLDESEADSDASLIYRKAQSAGAVGHTNVVRMIWAYRVLSSFYYNQNLYDTSNSTQISDHITSFLFDPETSDARAQNLKKLPKDIVTVPLAINTIADALAGFLYAQEMRGEYKKYRSYPSDPKKISSHMKELAELGRWVRSHEGGDALYEYHYAAMVYMRDHGWLSHAKKYFSPDFYPAVEDLFNDYFKAVSIAGSSKLADNDKAAAMAGILKGWDGYEEALGKIYSNLNPEPEPTPFS